MSNGGERAEDDEQPRERIAESARFCDRTFHARVESGCAWRISMRCVGCRSRKSGEKRGKSEAGPREKEIRGKKVEERMSREEHVLN